MNQTPWWKTTTIYQVYPRSFADANNDGIGDLRGIISKLDYIQELGFETIWVSPFFSSTQQDFGYDVCDYRDIAPEYGTLADAEDLIRQVHEREMKILFDLVLNHTSDQHPWFQESRSSRDNPKRDWYIWHDGQGKGPPNNWKAIPGGSAWHYDEATEQYYLANFLPFQPDLNWRNPEVKKIMLDTVRFWLDKGVDGFRLDIFHSIYKDNQLRDNPFSPVLFSREEGIGFFQKYKYNLNQPETIELARELRTMLDGYKPERMMIGEIFAEESIVKQYVGDDLDGFHMLFQWGLLDLKPRAEFLRDVIQHYEEQYPDPYTPVYVFGNHDFERLLSRLDGDIRLAKLLALFQFTMRGVPVTYYGEEIGMADGHFPAKTALDPLGKRFSWIPETLINWLGVYVNRDGCRTPMQWDTSPNAGFCSSEVPPWLPVHASYPSANVQVQEQDRDSILHTYRQLLQLRKTNSVLQTGDITLLDSPPDVLAYKRGNGDQTLMVVINFGNKPVSYNNPTSCRHTLLAVGMSAPDTPTTLELPRQSGLLLSAVA